MDISGDNQKFFRIFLETINEVIVFFSRNIINKKNIPDLETSIDDRTINDDDPRNFYFNFLLLKIDEQKKKFTFKNKKLNDFIVIVCCCRVRE